MRKRLLIGLLSAGLLVAMLPGVATAAPRYDGWYVFFICDDHQRYAPGWEAGLWYEGWPPDRWRSEVDWGLVEEGIDYLAAQYSRDCRAGGVGWFYYPG